MHTTSLNRITVTDPDELLNQDRLAKILGTTIPDGLLDQKRVAKILGTTEKFLEARRVRGGGPKFIRVGSLCRYAPGDLAEWIASRRVSSTSEAAK